MTMPAEDLLAFHRSATPLALPHAHPDRALVVTLYEEVCAQCRGAVKELRGRITDRPTCIEIHATGACPTCGRVSEYRVRWYGWGVLSQTDGGWDRYRFRSTRLGRLREMGKGWWKRYRQVGPAGRER